MKRKFKNRIWKIAKHGSIFSLEQDTYTNNELRYGLGTPYCNLVYGLLSKKGLYKFALELENGNENVFCEHSEYSTDWIKATKCKGGYMFSAKLVCEYFIPANKINKIIEFIKNKND
jgi:hypothetical protein